MNSNQLLNLVYKREEPLLKRNEWDALRIPISDLCADAAALETPATEAEVLDAVTELRLQGRIMLLPDWKNRWGTLEDAEDGTIVPSQAHWEPQGDKPGSIEQNPSWQPRKVFLPRREHLKYWFVRSRIAETIRLLGSNRERFGLEPATAHVGYELQQRRRPRRDVPVSEAVARLAKRVADGDFPRAERPELLRDAIAIAAAGVKTRTGETSAYVAEFQVRSWEAALDSRFGGDARPMAVMQIAGVSSGKTFGFLLPALTLLVYRLLLNEGGVVRVLVVYPRTSLVEDQYHELVTMIERVNAELAHRYPGKTLANLPGLDAGQLLGKSIAASGKSLADVLPEVAQKRVEIILTTPESMKNRMLDPRALKTFFRNVELVVFDEIHLLEGLSGCQQIFLIRRLGEMMRQLRGDPNFAPTWLGASATVAEPVYHAGQVFSIEPDRIQDVRPHESELEPFAVFHHAFIHTRIGKASMSAITNGLSCLTHTRNNGTAQTHYENPAGEKLTPRGTDAMRDMPKTIVFVDSLSTIGRLDFTTRDNERCWVADEETPYPYYTWFYRPASRLRAIAEERKTLKSLPTIQDWCQKCLHGVPARIDSAALRQLPEFLRTSRVMKESGKKWATPPGLVIPKGPGDVGNLDECPFHKQQLCWWFSQDRGERRLIGQAPIYIDQNRTVVYTSHTVDTSARTLDSDVNDYFRRSPADLWFVRDGDLRFTLPREPEAASTMLASPRIEVGVDFDNVRDGLTHKTLRSAASFQQKVGRVGRELDSDSLIVTFLAHRSTDAHFAHHPHRLISSQHLDPIPLDWKNPDVIATHLFTAALEFLASRPRGVIAGRGELLEVIGTGSTNVPEPWEAKVRGCLQYLKDSRQTVLDYVLRATRQEPSGEATHRANAALDALSRILSLFVVDLTPAFDNGKTAAHWIKENIRPNERTAFNDLMRNRQEALSLVEDTVNLPHPVKTAAVKLRDALRAQAAAQLTSVATEFQQTLIGQVSAMHSLTFAELFKASGLAISLASNLASLPAEANLEELIRAREIVLAFFRLDRDQRTQQLYYFHELLTRLLPFRDFYPHGLMRTHFQHVLSREVQIGLPGRVGDDDTEGLDTVLFELLPGTWNYRWGRGIKSPCGRLEQSPLGDLYCNLDRIGPGAEFRPTGTSFTKDELPADMPKPADSAVRMLRPVRLTMNTAANQPFVRREDLLIGDDDEASPADPSTNPPQCPTLPRGFPAMWYRVEPSPPPSASTATLSTYPPRGQQLFARDVVLDERSLQVDRYVYAIDRSYGLGDDPPRIHYRIGSNPVPVVLGDTLMRTDGLTFCLKPTTVDAVLDAALVDNAVRGEMTLRALRRFIASRGCDPYRTHMIRKVIAAHYLQNGGTLSTLDAGMVRDALQSLDRTRYDAVMMILLDGVLADLASAGLTKSRDQQRGWYEKAWAAIPPLCDQRAAFDDGYVRTTARDLLVHSLAVAALDAASRLAGASDGDLGYFYRSDRHELYLFDSVDGGNGYSETIHKYLSITPEQRAAETAEKNLPSNDWFELFEEVLTPCPAQTTARLLFDACRAGVKRFEDMAPPTEEDLRARLRHEFDPITGGQGVVAELVANWPAIFSNWKDLLWLQIVPEFFTKTLCDKTAVANHASLVARSHLCTSGCIECIVNRDNSVHGTLFANEHVSRTLLDALAKKSVG